VDAPYRDDEFDVLNDDGLGPTDVDDLRNGGGD
jgi:hypothetical protein